MCLIVCMYTQQMLKPFYFKFRFYQPESPPKMRGINLDTTRRTLFLFPWANTFFQISILEMVLFVSFSSPAKPFLPSPSPYLKWRILPGLEYGYEGWLPSTQSRKKKNRKQTFTAFKARFAFNTIREHRSLHSLQLLAFHSSVWSACMNIFCFSISF